MVKHPELKIVSVREHAVSTADSTKTLFVDKIDELGVSSMFRITDKGIFRIGGVGKIIFRGLKDHTAGAIKSLEGFDIAWVEEAQQLSERSLEVLEPTIRSSSIFPNAEIWFSWNPYVESDAVDKFFANGEGDDDFMLSHVNFEDNPFCPAALIKSAMRAKKFDFDKYLNIWLGHHLTRTDDQVFGGKWRVDTLEPNRRTWDGPYHGLDFGFSKDPMAAVKVWVTNNNKLYVEKEAGGVGVELDATAKHVKKKIPEFNDQSIRADSSAPQSISYLKRHGLSRIIGVDKWKGSIVDGINFMKAFDEIVVHPDCTEVQGEMANYRYKSNKGGDPLTDIIDADNHYIDAIRYALCPLIKTDGKFTDYGSLL